MSKKPSMEKFKALLRDGSDNPPPPELGEGVTSKSFYV
jgi:hypothetical protein